VFCYPSFVVLVLALLGARPALPMGVAPEAIAEFFLLRFRLKNIFFLLFLHRHILQEIPCFLFVLSNRRSMLLIRVAPRTIGGFLGNNRTQIVSLTYNFVDFTRYL
jgi:hypothetical protein